MKQFLFFISSLFIFAQLNAQESKNETHTLSSKHFKEERKITVHIPKDWDQKEKLPTIYVFDAQWDTYYNLVTSVVDYLTAVREFPKCIIVGVHSDKRQFELTPEPVNEDWKVPNLGGAKYLEDHLKDDIIPFINQKYNASSRRIGLGHSLGGTFVLNSLIDSPDLFTSYIAISPNLQIDDEEITLKIQRNLSNIKDQQKTIYTTIGNEGDVDQMFLPYVQKLDSIITSHRPLQLKWDFEVYDGFNHATSPLESIHNALLIIKKTL